MIEIAGMAIQNLGAFFCGLPQKNRAFRSNSSDLPMQILRDFRSNPLRFFLKKPAVIIVSGH
jgi:hypothetical protein